MKIINDNRKVLFVVIPILVILFPLAYSVGAFLFSQGAQKSQPFLEKPAAKYKKCVRDTTYMRFHHMDLLKEIRDESVREGKAEKITLENCRECHTSRERFCNQCHNAVNLNLDCFGCHYYPLKAQRSGEETSGG
jgi:hypothetical protein